MAVPPVRPIAERRLVAHFRQAGAVSLADAVPVVPDSAATRRAFDQLKGADVLKTDGQGRWYLDEERWHGRRSDRRTRVVLTMLAVAAAGAFAALR